MGFNSGFKGLISLLGNRKKSQGAKSGEYDGWGITETFVFRQKLVGEDGSVRRCVVIVKKPGLFSPKLGTMSSHFFTQSPQNFCSRTRNSQFGLLGQILYTQSPPVHMAAPVRKILDQPMYT